MGAITLSVFLTPRQPFWCVVVVTLLVSFLSDSNIAVAANDTSAIIGRKTTDTRYGAATTGKFRVFENRKAKSGRQIHLNFVVLHAKSETPRPDPVFFFVGGPGQAARSGPTVIEGEFREQPNSVDGSDGKPPS